MLLAGGAELRSAFRITAGGRRDGLDWVTAQPMDAQSDFREARFGFRAGELQQLVVVDKLGQRSTLLFSEVKRNAPVDPAQVTFTLPKGADLIGKPLP
jgi:outer membrane lipoprotein carrier protein